MPQTPFRLSNTLLACLVLFSFVLSACASTAQSAPNSTNHEMSMAPLDQMPPDVKSAPTTVQAAYRFAFANPDVLQQIPCYCGCGKMGHTSNYACYVNSVDSGGKITYDPHALGCSLCVDITQDAMRQLKQGKTVKEIRAYVDATYSKYGPSNMEINTTTDPAKASKITVICDPDGKTPCKVK